MDYTMREMEAADWASLSDQDLLERRISKLGLRLDGTAVEPLIKQLYDELSAQHCLLSYFHSPRKSRAASAEIDAHPTHSVFLRCLPLSTRVPSNGA
jgi:hypothetical protein